MKKAIYTTALAATGAVVVAVLTALAAPAPPPGTFRTNLVARWDQRTNEPTANLIVKLYTTTNPALPMTSWNYVTNSQPGATNVMFMTTAAARSFVATASNNVSGGTSDFSIAFAVPPAPKTPGLTLLEGASASAYTAQLTYPTNELGTNLAFVFYGSTNRTLPITNWSSFQVSLATNLSVPLIIPWGAAYVTVNATNVWGEALYAAPISLIPASPTGLSISFVP